MKVFAVIYDYGERTDKTYIAARNKEELMREWGDSNYMIKITDVTSEFDFSEHKDWENELQYCLGDDFSVGEIRLITKLVEEHIKKIKKGD